MTCLRDAVYKRRGWNNNGIPTIEHLKKIGMDFPGGHRGGERPAINLLYLVYRRPGRDVACNVSTGILYFIIRKKNVNPSFSILAGN